MPYLVPYVIAKTLAYTAWCKVGLSRRRGDLAPRRALALAAILGLLRAGLGLGFGLGIWLASSAVVVALHGQGIHDLAAEALAYLAVYVPVRAIEWGIVSALGLRGIDRPWIAGGIVVSVLCDIPMMLLLGGLPLGRFMC